MNNNEKTNTLTAIPNFAPMNINTKDLFNLMQDCQPISELVGKEFKIEGIMCDTVEMGTFRSNDDTDNNLFYDDSKVRSILKIILITNIGSFRSYSQTFNKRLYEAYKIFGDKFKDQTYLAKKVGKGLRGYYAVNAI